MVPIQDADALVLEGQRLRQTDPRALLAHAERIRQSAKGDARLQGFADIFAAWGQLAHGDRPAAEESLTRASVRMVQSGDFEGQMMCRGLQADLWIRDGRLGEVLEVAKLALSLPEGTLSRWELYRASSRQSTALEQLGEHDEALRAHYVCLAMARRAGEPALLANALGGAGGLQSSLLNLVDAASLCDEAWALCEHTPWHGVVQLVGVNRMGVLSGLGRHDEALAMAETLITREPAFPSRHRGARQSLYAMTLARAQHFDRAQQQLDLARADSPGDAVDWTAWIWIQAYLFNRTGRPDEAMALLAPYLELHRKKLEGGDFPVDRAHVFAEMARASEALGDYAAALVYERRAAAAREQAAAQAAHARRLTLQIDHELDAAHRARDDALREGERATHEQQRLAALNTELESANAAKNRFLAAASHDLRQPVQALAMYMAALQREPSASARNDLMTRMNQSLQALGSLFDVLLDVSRLDAGLVPVHPSLLRLDRLLRRLVDEHTLPARQRGLALRLRLPRDAPTAATVSDAVLLEGCLRNLLDNAIKYTARGGVVMRLRAGPAPATWRVELRDTGIGIDAALQAQVFQEFFQVGNEERDRSKGLGLGLSIVKRTAALLGHPLGLRSRPGHGSCFHIDLPRRDVGEDDGTAAVVHEEAIALGLIVIDDDASVRDSLAALLERWGHRVLQGADAPDVLAGWLRLGRPAVHAAIVDLRLRAGRTGLDAIADLRAGIAASLPTLVVTGDTAPQRLRLLADAGQPWLPKPLMPMRLRSWLQALP